MKIGHIILSVLLLLSVTGCQASNMGDRSSSASSRDFNLTLYTDKSAYGINDEIKIWATLEYKGIKNSISVWHDNPLINFSINSKTDNFSWQPLNDGILCTTAIKKTDKYTIDFSKPANLSKEDLASIEDARMKEFLENPKLVLSEGTYEIKAITRFSLSKAPKEDIKPETNLDIKILDTGKGLQNCKPFPDSMAVK